VAAITVVAITSKVDGNPATDKLSIKEMIINKSYERFGPCAKLFIKCCDQFLGTEFTSTSHTGS